MNTHNYYYLSYDFIPTISMTQIMYIRHNRYLPNLTYNKSHYGRHYRIQHYCGTSLVAGSRACTFERWSYLSFGHYPRKLRGKKRPRNCTQNRIKTQGAVAFRHNRIKLRDLHRFGFAAPFFCFKDACFFIFVDNFLHK